MPSASLAVPKASEPSAGGTYGVAPAAVMASISSDDRPAMRIDGRLAERAEKHVGLALEEVAMLQHGVAGIDGLGALVDELLRQRLGHQHVRVVDVVGQRDEHIGFVPQAA